MEQYRQILMLPDEYTREDVKSQYKKLSLKYHPDKNFEDKEKFIQLNKAYEFLLKNQH